jgi:hypothetical protein
MPPPEHAPPIRPPGEGDPRRSPRRLLADRLVDEAVRFCGRLLGRGEHDLDRIAGAEAEAAAGELAGLVIHAVDLIAELGFDPDEVVRRRLGAPRPAPGDDDPDPAAGR